MLNRHVEIRQNPILARDDLEQPVGDSRRIQVEHSDPRNRSLGDERFEQLRELVPIAAVAAVVREILRDEIELARALQLEQLRFAHDFVEREGAVLARA